MPGVIYRVLAKAPYDFSSVATGASQTYNIAKAIDVSAYREATAVIRLHAVSISASSTPSISVVVLPEAPTAEDPALDFIYNPGTVTTVVLSSASTAPQLVETNVSTPFGGFLRVNVLGNQPSAANKATTFQVTLSIDIVAKS